MCSEQLVLIIPLFSALVTHYFIELHHLKFPEAVSERNRKLLSLNSKLSA